MQIQEMINKISRGTAEIISSDILQKKLERSLKDKKPLVVKAGFDPTAPDIHLGHVVLLKKLRQFQDFGHEVHFLIGDFTAQVGDPSGQDQMRNKMDAKEIARNAKTYKDQVFKILDAKKTRVGFNSKWLSKLKAQDVLELSSHITVAQMLARADFKKRYEDGREISILEFIYPLLQGYDSVHMKADIELGGTDQKFNLLMGRQLQASFSQEPQVVIMLPLLEGTDGVKKMSKSLNNYIGINETAKDIFGKVMSISDELMIRYYEILTEEDLGSVQGLHPKEAKLNLAEEIVSQFHSKIAARKARDNFERTFSLKQDPDDLGEYRRKGKKEALIDVLVNSKLVDSKREAKRLIKQGAVSLGGEKVSSEDCEVKVGILKVGKRRFLRII